MEALTRRNALVALGAPLLAGMSDPFAAGASQNTGSVRVGDFGPVRRITAGPLRIGYVDAGPVNGRPVVLLHGWPYDIHAFRDVTNILTAAGFRAIIPYLRGFGRTSFLSDSTLRSGQQAALAADLLALLDALKLKSAVLAGFDWGARAACAIAALWPNRCSALVSASGYLIGNQSAGRQPLPPEAELSWWYQFYFATARGEAGYAANRANFAKLIWRLASPEWRFSEAEFGLTEPSLFNADHVAIVIHNYRWRLGLVDGDPVYQAIEKQLSNLPVITVPTITIEGDANHAPHPLPGDYAKKFVGKYRHIPLTGGVGHNPAQEAPADFAAAIMSAADL